MKASGAADQRAGDAIAGTSDANKPFVIPGLAKREPEIHGSNRECGFFDVQSHIKARSLHSRAPE
jgi:hypothetical protein